MKNFTQLRLFYLDVGRATYAEMLYRTNLIAYVPADHVTGLPSNVGTEKILSGFGDILNCFDF
jgi:hypothetical protein